MSNNRFKILIVEDEVNIRNLLETVLESNGYHTLWADSCAMGKTLFLSHNPDLILLDLGLGDGDGNQLIQTVRKSSSVPILVVSARTGESDKVESLDLGANDYITKPFGTAELLARVRAALRHNRTASTGKPHTTFRLGELEINYEGRQVKLRGENVPLTQTEYNILTLLSFHPGKVLTYSAIIRAVWGYQDPGSVKRLQVNMANLRRKLGIRPGSDSYIANELGVGYRMCTENE